VPFRSRASERAKPPSPQEKRCRTLRLETGAMCPQRGLPFLDCRLWIGALMRLGSDFGRVRASEKCEWATTTTTATAAAACKGKRTNSVRTQSGRARLRSLSAVVPRSLSLFLSLPPSLPLPLSLSILPTHSNFANGCFFHFAASTRSSLSPEQSASRRALRYDRRAEDRKVSRWIQQEAEASRRCSSAGRNIRAPRPPARRRFFGFEAASARRGDEARVIASGGVSSRKIGQRRAAHSRITHLRAYGLRQEAR